MRREGFKKSKARIHGHNECSICSGHFKTKRSVKQKVRKLIKEETVSRSNG